MYGKKTGYLYMSDLTGDTGGIIGGAGSGGAQGLPAGYSVGTTDPVLGTPIPTSAGAGTVDASGGALSIEAPIVGPEGRPVSKCAFFARNPANIPSSDTYSSVKETISSSFSCACNSEQCAALSPKGYCLYGLCPGATYCCSKQTAGMNIGAGGTPDPSSAVPNIGNTPDYQTICTALAAAEKEYGMPTDLLKAIAYQESHWNPKATNINLKESSYGLMQINTKWHPDYDVDQGKTNAGYNIEYGAKFLYTNYQSTKDWQRAVVKYNGAGIAAENYGRAINSLVQSKPWVNAFGVDCSDNGSTGSTS
jgi:hypothetical protein